MTEGIRPWRLSLRLTARRSPPWMISPTASCTSRASASTPRSTARVSRCCCTPACGPRPRCGGRCCAYLPGYQVIAFDPPGVGRSGDAAAADDHDAGWPRWAPRSSTSSASSPRTCSARRSAAPSRSRWRSASPGRVRSLVLVSTSFGGLVLARRPDGVLALHAAQQLPAGSGCSRWPAACSAAGCAPSRNSCAPCTSGVPSNLHGGHVPDGPAARLDQPAVAVGDPPADADRLR